MRSNQLSHPVELLNEWLILRVNSEIENLIMHSLIGECWGAVGGGARGRADWRPIRRHSDHVIYEGVASSCDFFRLCLTSPAVGNKCNKKALATSQFMKQLAPAAAISPYPISSLPAITFSIAPHRLSKFAFAFNKFEYLFIRHF